MKIRSNLLKSGIEIPVLSEMEALKLYFCACKTGLQTAIKVALELTLFFDFYFKRKSSFCGRNSLLFHCLQNGNLVVFLNEVKLINATDSHVSQHERSRFHSPLPILSTEPHRQPCRTAPDAIALNHFAMQGRDVS